MESEHLPSPGVPALDLAVSLDSDTGLHGVLPTDSALVPSNTNAPSAPLATAAAVGLRDERQGVFVTGGTFYGPVIGINYGQVYTVSTEPYGSRIGDAQTLKPVRLDHTLRPPRPPVCFLDRTDTLRLLRREMQARRGVWIRGSRGCGLSTLLRQASNTPEALSLPDGVVYLADDQVLPSLNDTLQKLFNFYFYTDDMTVKLTPELAQTELGSLEALFLFDRPPLGGADLKRLSDVLRSSAVFIAADGPTPDTYRDLSISGMPRKYAMKCCANATGIEHLPASAVPVFDQICAILEDMPLPLVLVGRLAQHKANSTARAVGAGSLPAGSVEHAQLSREAVIALLAAALDMQTGAGEPLARAASLVIADLSDDARAVLAALVRIGGRHASVDALADISRCQLPIVEHALDHLVELGMVEPNDARFVVTSTSLRRVLDLLLPAGSERSRAATFFAVAAAAHQGDLAWLEFERANIVAAIETSLAGGQAAQAGALAQAIQPLLLLEGSWDGWGTITDYAEQAAQLDGDDALLAWALHERGTRAGLLGDEAAAAANLEQALRLREQLGDSEGAALTRHNIERLGLLVQPLDVSPEPHRQGLLRRHRRAIIIAVVAVLLLFSGATIVAQGVAGPKPAGDEASTVEDRPVHIAVMANDRSWLSSLDPVSVHVVAGPAHGSTSVDATTGEISYTPHQNFFGTDRFNYQICDKRQKCASTEVAVAVAPINDRPAANDDAAATNEDTPTTLDVASNDTDVEGKRLTVVEVKATSEQGGTAAIEGGLVRYAPPTNFNGTDVFSYTISDGGGLSATATVTVNVRPINDAPTFIIGESQSIEEDAELRMVEWAREISPGPADERQQSLAFEVTTTNPGLFAEQPAISSRGTLTYRPARNAFGEAMVTVILRDDGGMSDGGVDSTDPQTVVITIRPVNDSPTAGADTAMTDEDTPVTIDVLAHDHDIDPRDKLTVTSVSPKSAKQGSVALDSAGKTVIYLPASNFFGQDSFSYTIGDGNGGEATGTVQVTVREVNDRPVAADDGATTNEDEPVTIDVLLNDSDVEKGIDLSSVRIVAAPANGVATADRKSGAIGYAPQPNYFGPDSLGYEVCDRSKACVKATVGITVESVNDRPTVQNHNASTPEDTPMLIDVLMGAADADGAIDPATLRIAGGPAHGQAVVDKGRVRYTPAGDYTGDDRFTYQVCDTGAPQLCPEASVDVTVTPVNDPLRAVNDETTTREGVSVEIDVLTNDIDPDDNINRQTARVSRQAANGWAAVNPATGIFGYKPSPNFVGKDSFSYKVCDDGGVCAEASVTVRVTANRPPPKPRLQTPANEASFNPNEFERQKVLALVWGAVSDEDGIAGYEYVLEMAEMAVEPAKKTAVKYRTLKKDSTNGATKASISLSTIDWSGNRWYRWRVRAIDGVGKQGAYSDYFYFYVEDDIR